MKKLTPEEQAKAIERGHKLKLRQAASIARKDRAQQSAPIPKDKLH